MTTHTDDRTFYPHVPASVLLRHNARVLDPATAVSAPGQPAPRSTVYRTDRLFVPDEVHRESEQRTAVDAALRTVNLRLAAAPAEPGPATLEIVDSATPTVVDSWVALQALHTAAASDPTVEKLVGDVRLVHLLFAATDPTTNEPGPYEPSGPKGAVRTLFSPPPEPDTERDARLAGPAVRRPVVAVVDSGDGPAADAGDRPTHGALVAGVLRRQAPLAAVRAIPVMHADGVVHEDELEGVLGDLVDAVAGAQSGGDAADMVDVVSLSLGYFHEHDRAGAEASTIAAHIRSLTAMGVPVIAAAGNHATTRPYFPAALTAHLGDGDDPTPGLLSVGARESDRGVSGVGDDSGDWVRYLRPGATGGATGSSFAVPVLAAELVSAMDPADPGDVDLGKTVRRARAAVATLDL